MNIIEKAFEKFVELETERFMLREPKEQDSSDVYEIYCDEEAVKYQAIKPAVNKEQGEQAVAYFVNGFKNKKFIRWSIEDKENRKVVGLISLHSFDPINSKAEIGFMLNRRFWRKGIMNEAAERVIKYAFEEMEIHRIEAIPHPDNIASINLSLKLGFKKEGLKHHGAYNRRTEMFEGRVIMGIVNG